MWVCGCGGVGGMWVNCLFSAFYSFPLACGAAGRRLPHFALTHWPAARRWMLGVERWMFIPSCLRRGGTPSPYLASRIPGAPPSRQRLSAFQLSAFQLFSSAGRRRSRKKSLCREAKNSLALNPRDIGLTANLDHGYIAQCLGRCQMMLLNRLVR